MRSLLFGLIACSGKAPTPVQPPAVPATTSDATTPDDAAETPLQQVTARIVHLVIAGPRPEAEVRLQIERAIADVARCGIYWPASQSLGIQVALTPDNRFVGFGGDHSAPILFTCVGTLFGDPDEVVLEELEPTFLYVALAFDLKYMPLPTVEDPPVLRDDLEDACSMFARSGANNESGNNTQKRQTAQLYFRTKVRHPELYQLAWRTEFADASVRKRLQLEIRKRVKPKVCADPGW